MEGIIQITARPRGKIEYTVLKGIRKFKTGEELTGTMDSFFGGYTWKSVKLSKKYLQEHPELFL